MTVNSTWVDPSAGQSLDLAVGSTLTEAWSDGLASNLGYLGGADGKSGYAGPRVNLLVNGGHDVWQRGNGPFTASGTYAADRWTLSIPGGDTLSISKSTATKAPGSVASSACTYTKTPGGTYYGQWLKISDGYQIAGLKLSASALVNTTTAGAVQLGITGDGTGAAAVISAAHPGGGVWQTLAPTTYTVPADATYVLVYIAFSANCTAYVDNMTCVPAQVVPEYIPLHPADDLARCLRYYELIAAASNVYIAPGVCYGTTNAMGLFQYTQPKATTPTITLSAANTFGVTSAGLGVIACTGVAATQQAGRLVSLTLTVASGLVGGNATVVLANTGQTATIAIEANP